MRRGKYPNRNPTTLADGYVELERLRSPVRDNFFRCHWFSVDHNSHRNLASSANAGSLQVPVGSFVIGKFIEGGIGFYREIGGRSDAHRYRARGRQIHLTVFYAHFVAILRQSP
jgi:hypothetical protein